MDNFFTKEIYTIDDIYLLIQNEIEESVNLDFKAAGALDKSDKKKLEIAKDVSSFANSDGGIIIYGITEKDHKADSISFVNGNEYTKEWLEQVINTNIQRHIENVKIFPIRVDGDITKSIYVVKIPCSYNAPHMNKDKKYYRRYNFESVQMEEYEIRQLYNRKGKADIKIMNYVVALLDDIDGMLEYDIEVNIVNSGSWVEELYKTNFYVEGDSYWDCSVSWPKHVDHNTYQIVRYNDPSQFKISCMGTFPIFPNECTNSMRFQLKLPCSLLEESNNPSFKIKLLYSGGEDDVKIPLDLFMSAIESYYDEINNRSDEY